MATTVKDLILKYRERFSDSRVIAISTEHQNFWDELTNLGLKRWKSNTTLPPDIDAATELSTEEATAWLRRMANLPQYV